MSKLPIGNKLGPARSWPAGVWRSLVRMDVAVVLLAIVMLAAAFGSCFPSVPSEISSDAKSLVLWEAGIRARYGALTDLLSASGLFDWFHAPIFLLPLAALVIATLACTLDRGLRVWWRAFSRPGKRMAALASLLNHVAVPLLLAGVMLSNLSAWRERVTLEPGATLELGHGKEFGLRSERFAMERYPDGSVASYRAELTLIEGGEPVARGGVQVNRPLSYDGMGVYLQGYQETQGDYSPIVLVVHDPGYGLVIAAGFLLLLGLGIRLCS
jgi:cytochrome c biogenesis protein ResB